VRAGEGVAIGATVFPVLNIAVSTNGARFSLPGKDVEAKDDGWLLWQLADSAFPTGGFAHSGGLEAAWQHGEVRNPAELSAFIEASLEQLGHGSLPFVMAAHDEAESAEELDRLCDCFFVNHVSNRASRLLGRSFLASSGRIFPGREVARVGTGFPCGHFAPVFGAVTRELEVSRSGAGNLFVFQHLRGLVAGAVRLGIVGPMEGQALQHRLGPFAKEVLARCKNLTIDEVAQTAPLLELWQGTQDRLYSRLFQS
jgi:urease accessory protein